MCPFPTKPIKCEYPVVYGQTTASIKQYLVAIHLDVGVLEERRETLEVIWSGVHYVRIYKSSIFGEPCFDYCLCWPSIDNPQKTVRKYVKRRLRQKAFRYLSRVRAAVQRITEKVKQKIEDDFIRSWTKNPPLYDGKGGWL